MPAHGCTTQAADRAATRLGRDVYLFSAGHQELGKVLHDG